MVPAGAATARPAAAAAAGAFAAAAARSGGSCADMGMGPMVLVFQDFASWTHSACLHRLLQCMLVIIENMNEDEGNLQSAEDAQKSKQYSNQQQHGYMPRIFASNSPQPSQSANCIGNKCDMLCDINDS
jgi:hypothetical protein